MISQLHSLPSYQQVTRSNQVNDDTPLSERDKRVVPAKNQFPWENITKGDLGHINTNNMIWVPAAKHPQIAPNEFLEWIKTHGGTTPYNKNPVRRQRSTLSTTYTSSEEDDDDDDDDDDENYTILDVDDDDNDLSASSMNPIAANDTNLPEIQHHTIPLDTTTSVASQEKPVLSRRKALTSRGQHISRRQASIKHETARKASDKNNFMYDSINNNNSNSNSDGLKRLSSDGVQLFDPPVDINEWVDLGNVIEIDCCQKFLHRMHTAETLALTRQASTPATTPSSVTPRQGLRRSISNRLSWTQNIDKKSPSWISGLFGKHRSGNGHSNSTSMTTSLSAQVHPDVMSSPTLESTAPSPPISRSSSLNLISYLSRKLSFSSTPSSSSSSKPDKQANRSPRRRYSNFLLHGKNMKKKYQVTPMETDYEQDEQRLPLHLERGVYRLSHMKLANPRRPLREQVIITNFMFWYLSLINMHPHQINYPQQQQQQQLDYQDNSTTNYQYTNDPTAVTASSSSSSFSCGLEKNHLQLEKNSSSISHQVHTPLKRPPVGTSKDLTGMKKTNPTAKPVSPLALKNSKDKYKPIKNTYFGKQTSNHIPPSSSL